MKNKILIVDDEPEICEELSLYLSKKGYEIITAGDGKEGLKMYDKHRPSIVITDYKMPKKNGFELFIDIQKIDSTAKVIIMSAVIDLDPFVLTKTEAAFEFLHKPLNLNELLSLIKNEK